MLKLESPTRLASIDDLLSDELVARISALDISSRKIFRGKVQGERRSKKRGQSVEFADHRPYVVGDDLRHIDWNIYGRLDRMFMKLFMEDEDLSLHVVVDVSGSGDCGRPSKFEFMQRAAMALGYIGLVNLNRVSMTGIGPADAGMGGGIVSAARDLRGRRRTRELASWICGLEPRGVLAFRDACKRLALSRRGRGVMVVMSDFFLKEGYEDGLRLLVGRGYDVVALQVLSPQELDPAGPDGIAGDLRLRDCEDSDVAEITISAPLLKRYKANLAAYCDGLRTFCAQREIQCITVSSATPINTLLLDYFRRRGVVA